jgi:ferredoxin-NADP reductase
MATLASDPPRPGLGRRLLGSPVVDLLLGPHGVDRYLELISPTLTVTDARAEVVAVRRQTPRSVTLTLRPNRAWNGFRPGQYVAVGVEIDGVRRTRTYSPASSAHRGRQLELTITEHPGGLVSGHLLRGARIGAVVHLAGAQGTFTLPDPRPERIALISGGSGITPVLSMLRTLVDEGHDGEVAFLHFARTEADWLYEPEVRALADGHPGLKVAYRTTRGARPSRLDAAALRALIGDAHDAAGAVCGPPSLIDAAPAAWSEAGGDPERVLTETFTPPRLLVTGEAATGTLRFLRSDHAARLGEGTLLEQAEAAGLSPRFGCRMGICHTCTCRKTAGAVRNLRTGAVSDEDNEDIQLCISAPAGDVALEL